MKVNKKPLIDHYTDISYLQLVIDGRNRALIDLCEFPGFKTTWMRYKLYNVRDRLIITYKSAILWLFWLGCYVQIIK
jgi:hypothetical protein